MIDFFILEDNALYATKLFENLKTFLMIEELPIKLDLVTSSAKEMLKNIKNRDLNSAIFLLDIELTGSEYSGIDVAEIIRKNFPLAEIIFITSHSESALTIITHKIEPFDLISKVSMDTDFKRLRSDIIQINKQMNNRKLHIDKLFSYSINGQVYSVPINNLIYIETIPTNSGNLKLHTKSEIAIFHNTLNNLEKKYKMLFRCHKSFLINPEHLIRFNSKERYIYMDDGSRLEVSFRKISELRKFLK